MVDGLLTAYFYPETLTKVDQRDICIYIYIYRERVRRRGGLVFSSKRAFLLQFSYGFGDYPIGEDIQIVDNNFYRR